VPYLSLITVAIAGVILIKSVGWFIDSSSKLATRFNVSYYSASIFVVAVATSLPEIVVAVTSALGKNSILSFGNAIGANISLLTFVTALPILVGTSIATRTIIHNKDIYLAVAFCTIPLLLGLDQTLSRADGAVLLACYAAYTTYVMRRRDNAGTANGALEQTPINTWKQGFLFLVSIFLLLVASELIVKSALTLSNDFKVSLGFVGLSITAVGTTLPEIAFSLGAIKKRHQFEILGNVVGSIVANSGFVLGIAAVIHPIELGQFEAGTISMLVLIFILLLYLRFSKTKEKLDKFEAIIMLAIYFAFIAGVFYLQQS